MTGKAYIVASVFGASVFGTALLGPSVAQAQPLAEFLSAASKNGFDARAASAQTAQASARSGAAWSGLLPSLAVSAGWTHNQYPAIVSLPGSDSVTIVPKDQLDAQLRVQVPLLDPSRWVSAAAASASASAASSREGAARQQLERDVVLAYYRAVSATAVEVSAQRSLELAQAQLALSRSRREAGVANALDVARAAAEVARVEQQAVAAQTDRQLSCRALETLTGLAPQKLPPLGLDDATVPPPLAELEARTASLASVEAASLDATAASRTQTAAVLALVPAISAQATQRFTNATGFQGQPALYSAGVSLDWRLDGPAFYEARARRAAEALASIEAERARRRALDQLHSDWLSVTSATSRVKSAKAQLDAAREANALATDRSSAGFATQLDVIVAGRDLFSAEVSVIQTRADLAAARAALALSAGLDPKEASP